MKKTKLKGVFVFSLLFALVAPILMAGGGGNGGGGGGGGTGKNSSGGGKGYTPPPTDWTSTTLTENWTYARVNNNQPIDNPCSNGPTLPPYSYLNTCPNNPSQTIYNSGGNYYCNISVQNVTTKEIRTFCRYSTFTSIDVPTSDPYQITFEFYEKCSNCMSPAVINLPIGQGRRIEWKDIKTFNAYQLGPVVFPVWLGLVGC